VPRILNRRYELHHAIGAGGAATVYRGTDRQLHRDVAVKLLNDVAARSADPGGRERFLREARTGAAVHHHNLVDIYDAGEDNGVLYLVMELVQGSSLATLIADRAPLPVDEAVGIATEILGGLSALHATGTIHRDVKPANVLVDETGEVRLTDFGIAKRLDEIEGALTSDDTVIGTPSYIAPEQAAGSGLSAATDVYAVGLVLYEMLTGRRAFERESPMAATPGDDPLPLDPRSVRPEVPDHVARAVVQATHRDPARRFADAATMAHVLTDGPPTALAGTATLVMPAGLQPPGHPDRTQRMPAAAMPAAAASRDRHAIPVRRSEDGRAGDVAGGGRVARRARRARRTSRHRRLRSAVEPEHRPGGPDRRLTSCGTGGNRRTGDRGPTDAPAPTAASPGRARRPRQIGRAERQRARQDDEDAMTTTTSMTTMTMTTSEGGGRGRQDD
jgi:eukaryotic-like serine/threonine-protein kinase